VQPWLHRWDHADEAIVHPSGPHTDESFEAYLTWYQPLTRCRITYANLHPTPHVASSQDGYARWRDEQLAGAVSHFFIILVYDNLLNY
jgi:hypothetical protein